MIGISLSMVLHRWIPEQEKKKWDLDKEGSDMGIVKVCLGVYGELHLLKVPKSRKEIIDGNNLIKALVEHPDLVPWITYPQGVYILLSEKNFIYASRFWLRYALERKGYLVCDDFDFYSANGYNQTKKMNRWN
jgi:hypothetical protein